MYYSPVRHSPPDRSPCCRSTCMCKACRQRSIWARIKLFRLIAMLFLLLGLYFNTQRKKREKLKKFVLFISYHWVQALVSTYESSTHTHRLYIVKDRCWHRFVSLRHQQRGRTIPTPLKHVNTYRQRKPNKGAKWLIWKAEKFEIFWQQTPKANERHQFYPQ